MGQKLRYPFGSAPPSTVQSRHRLLSVHVTQFQPTSRCVPIGPRWWFDPEAGKHPGEQFRGVGVAGGQCWPLSARDGRVAQIALAVPIDARQLVAQALAKASDGARKTLEPG